jgi:hypothetical protein
MIVFIALTFVLILLVAGVLMAPQRFRGTLAIAGYLVLGALLSLSPLEIGVYGIVIAATTLLGLFVAQGDNLTRLERIGAYLFGGGIGGIVLLLSIVVRIGNICGGSAQATPLPGGGASYECYAVETLWALLPYGALAGLGILMLFLAWRRRSESTMSSRIQR